MRALYADLRPSSVSQFLKKNLSEAPVPPGGWIGTSCHLTNSTSPTLIFILILSPSVSGSVLVAGLLLPRPSPTAP